MGVLAQYGWSESHLHRYFPFGTFCASKFFRCSCNEPSEIKLAARASYLYAASDFTN
jgi:hypothetical protein